MLGISGFVRVAVVLFCGMCQAAPLIDDGDSARIVNGSKASNGQFPFAVSMQVMYTETYFDHSCTLSLITTKTCLGAAHCAYGEGTELLPIDKVCGIVGTIDQSQKKPCHKYSKIFVHEAYDATEVFNDIATFIFVEEMKLDKTLIDIVPLITSNELITEETVTVLGWGNLHNLREEESPNILRYVVLELLPPELCDLKNTQLCIVTKGKGVCTGDSGGPSITNLSGERAQVGVSSYVNGECASSFSVLTAVASYTEWIKEHSTGSPTFIYE